MRRIPGKENMFLTNHTYSSTYVKSVEKDGVTRVDTEAYGATDVVGTLIAAAVVGFGVRAGSIVFDKAAEIVPKVANKASKAVSSAVDRKERHDHSDPNAKEGIDDEEELDD